MMSPLSTGKAPTKAQDVYGRLFEIARGLGPNAKLPTVQQLRRDLKVSITTLDGVLKQLESESVIFKRQGSGIFVSPRLHQRCIGLVCEPAFFSARVSPFWQEMIERARLRALQDGEAFRFYLALRSFNGTSPLPDDLIEDIAAQRINGVLFLGNNEAAQDWLKQRQVPTVVFAGSGDYRVELDREQIISVAGRHLIERGCQRPALLCHWETRLDPPFEPHQSFEIQAFQRLLNDSGLPYYPHLMWDARAVSNRVPLVPETHQEQGFQAVMSLFDGSHSAPDGLFSMDDMMTIGALTALRILDLKPGRDVVVVSHINRGSKILNGEDENITFVEVDPFEIVSTMFSQLESLMDNKVPAPLCALIKAHLRN